MGNPELQRHSTERDIAKEAPGFITPSVPFAERRDISMKKLLLVLVFVLAHLLGSQAEAGVPSSECYIGKLHIGMDSDEVAALYGRPKAIRNERPHPLFRGKIVVWDYGALIGQVVFANDRIIRCSVTTPNPDLATPAGVTVRMKRAVMEDIYGEPDVISPIGENGKTEGACPQ